MTQHDDAGEDLLAGIDLHAWRVPPPAPLDRPTLLGRALSPIGAPRKRARVGWILAAVVLVNAAIATLLVIVLRPSPQRSVIVEPAGGGTVDAQVRELLQRLEQEQRELESKLAEIHELRTLVVELAEKVRRYEQQDDKRDRPRPKERDRQRPAPVDRRPVDPFDTSESNIGSCDEVSCVLTNYADACCAKYRSPRAPSPATNPFSDNLPRSLDRISITNGIASVKARVAACASRSPAKGKVKVRVQVDPRGEISQLVIDTTPDPALGACVATALRSAKFPRTVEGGTFTYPFVF